MAQAQTDQLLRAPERVFDYQRLVDGLVRSGLPAPALRSAGAGAAVLLFVLSTHVYFQKVRAEAEEGSRLQEAVAARVRRSLGDADVIIALFPGQSPDEYEAFIKLAAYGDLEKLRATGLELPALWGFWSCTASGTVPSFPADNRWHCLLVPQELVAEPGRCGGLRIVEQIPGWLPGTSEEMTKGRRGDALFTTWCTAASPR
jgi:hypothetical protein